eukprot:1677680-Amphidinium_carterae.1
MQQPPQGDLYPSPFPRQPDFLATPPPAAWTGRQSKPKSPISKVGSNFFLPRSLAIGRDCPPPPPEFRKE